MLPQYSHRHFRAASIALDGAADGLAFLSRFPLVAASALELSRRTGTEDPFDRVLLCGRFQTPGGPLHVLNAHFSWVEEQACDNAAEAVPWINAISGPCLLLGDLNNTPDARPLQALRSAGWEDLWPRFQMTRTGYTFESDRPARRIDYALANAALGPLVRGLEVVGDQADGDVRPSDHLGLLLSLATAETA